MADPKLVVVYNQKGGVGKTTIAVNLAALSARSGRRTLLVDSDPQGNSTCSLRGNAPAGRTLADFYESCLGLNLFRQSLMEYVTTDTGIENMHLVAADRSLEELRNKLENKHKIHKLRDGLRSTAYEVVYFDPPPAGDFFALACLIAAKEVLVPIDCDSFSVRAARDIRLMVEEVRADHNPDLRIRGVIINQYQKSAKHGAAIVRELREGGFEVLEPFVPSSVKVRESHSDAVPLVVSAPDHPVSEALAALHLVLFPEDVRRAGAHSQNRGDAAVKGAGAAGASPVGGGPQKKAKESACRLPS
jgi:chromosome partitioning protein